MNIKIPTLVLCFAAGTLLAADAKKPGYKDTPVIPGTKWHVHDSDRPHPPIVKPAEKFSQGAPPPADAIVLFDGKDFSKWKSGKGGEVTWKIENGYMEVTPKSGIIRTADEFGDFQLHLEWATPSKVESEGQGRGNNGVNIFGRYEVQILDSYDNVTFFQAPRWDDSGKLLSKAKITVIHNGLVLHHGTELVGRTGHRSYGNYDRPHPSKGPIELYEHGNPVRFRNIWIRPLGEYDGKKS
jgi:hypothetical protein